jgi:hypothetical protein
VGLAAWLCPVPIGDAQLAEFDGEIVLVGGLGGVTIDECPAVASAPGREMLGRACRRALVGPGASIGGVRQSMSRSRRAGLSHTICRSWVSDAPASQSASI